jgi:hypothetical protein
MRAIVIFQDASGHPLSPLLKHGFRHVVVTVDDGRYWIECDPATGTPRFTVMADSAFDLAGDYRKAGLTLVETETRTNTLLLPLTLSNCVGVAKAVLGITHPLIVTPYQLYRHLARPR